MDFSNLTLREKILKTFIVTIREINTHGGPEEFFKKYPVGGLFYSEGPKLLDENGVNLGVACDQEELELCRKLCPGQLMAYADACSVRGQNYTSWPQTSLGSSQLLEDAYNWGKVTGMQFNDRGVDVIYGPSIDMCIDHQMYLMSINDDPEIIAKVYRQVIRGIQDQGVCATAKHFPGLGTWFVNMHMAPGANKLPFDEWMETYGYTYSQMFQEDVMSVMTTHATLRSYDDETHDGYLPIATFSEKLTTELLKGKLGFQGAVVTDALVMGGMATGDLVAETVQAFKAGADLLLYPPVETVDVLEQMLLSGEIPMSRLNDALARIGRMMDFRNAALEGKTYDQPDPVFADETLKQITRNGICQLRNDRGLLPLKPQTYKKVLVVDGGEKGSKAAEYLCTALQEKGFGAEVKREIYDVPSNISWQADVDKLQANYDLVIFSMDAYFAAEWSETHMLIWASHQFDKAKKIIVNYRSPYFAVDYFPEDPTFIEMNCDPSLEAARMLVQGILGEIKFTGKSRLKEQ